MGNWLVGLWILTSLSHSGGFLRRIEGKCVLGLTFCGLLQRFFSINRYFFSFLFVCNDYDFDSYLCVHCIYCNFVV